nr:uncharacterized protein LOC109147873 [Ipomoea batatas]
MSDCRRSRTGNCTPMVEEGYTEENGGAETDDEALRVNKNMPPISVAKGGESMNESDGIESAEVNAVAENDLPAMAEIYHEIRDTPQGGITEEVAIVEGEVNIEMRERKEKEVCEESGGGDQTQEESSSEEVESTQSVSYGTWAENLKKKAGEDSDLIKVIEEAKQEVGRFFQLAFKELGKEIYDECSDEIVKKANEFFILKLEREGKEIGSRLKKELGWIEKDTPATKRNENGESDESSNASSKRKGRVIKNSMDWVDIVKEFMEKDNEFERKVKEALKAVNDYLWTVFDKEKNAYLEDGKARAVRGAAIFLEIVKQSPAWGAENDLLGRILKPNQELIAWLLLEGGDCMNKRGVEGFKMRRCEYDDAAVLLSVMQYWKWFCNDSSWRTEEHKSVPISDPLESEKEIENQEGKTNVTDSSRMDEEQRTLEGKDLEETGIAQLSNEEIEILMENGFKESIFLLRTQHQAVMAALRSIKMEKSQSTKSDSKESHRPLDGGNQAPRMPRESSEEHQSIPIGPIPDRHREAIEKTKIGQKLDLTSEDSFPELKDHQPLDGGPGKDDGGIAKEKGVKFAGETTYYFERGLTSGTKQDQGSDVAAGKESEVDLEKQKTAEKMAEDLPAKQNLEGDETSGDEGKATAVIGGAYGVLGQIDEEGNEIEKINENEIDPGPDWLGDGDLSRFSEEVQVIENQCTDRINCVADCFVNACANVSVIYIKKDALPRGIGRVLALEGVPHFVFVPGLDFA